MYFHIHTFGCKVNQYETESLRTEIAAAGFTETEIEFAEVVIVNSCMVTQTAEEKVKRFVKTIKNSPKNIGQFVVLTGCMAAKSIVTDADFSSNDKSEIIGRLVRLYQNSRMEIAETLKNGKRTGVKTRKFIKIQDGCDNFCAYCVIPYARNSIFSKPIAEILKEVEIAANTHKEIVLIGINLARYCSEGMRLADVAEKCAAVRGVERIRFGSLEPELITEDDLEKLSQIPEFCPNFHYSLQSGCDKILKLMRRKYTVAEYEKLIKTTRKYFPDCSVTTDIIVGFPHETDENFEETRAFAEGIGFMKIHVFPFSPRFGTLAADNNNYLIGAVDERVKSDRAKILQQLSEKLATKFYNSQIGKTYPVLFEREINPSFHVGHTPNFLTVKIPAADCVSWQGQIRSLVIRRYQL